MLALVLFAGTGSAFNLDAEIEFSSDQNFPIIDLPDIPILPDVNISVDLNSGNEFDFNSYVARVGIPCEDNPGHTCLRNPDWAETIDYTRCISSGESGLGFPPAVCISGPQAIKDHNSQLNAVLLETIRRETEELRKQTNPEIYASLNEFKNYVETFFGGLEFAVIVLITAVLLAVIIFIVAFIAYRSRAYASWMKHFNPLAGKPVVDDSPIKYPLKDGKELKPDSNVDGTLGGKGEEVFRLTTLESPPKPDVPQTEKKEGGAKIGLP